MDVFGRKLLFSFALATGIAVAPAAQEVAPPVGIDLSADSLGYQGGSNRVVFAGFQLSEGDKTIEADTASASEYDFEQSEWELSGDVRMSVGPVRLESNTARFRFLDNQLQQIELQGEPAMFERPDPADSRRASGGANRIFYDEVERRLSLIGNAWLSVGSNEVVGCDLVYDIDASGDELTFWSGSTECDERFRIRISPAAGDGADVAPQTP